MKPESIPLNRMYGDLAHLWLLVTPPEDYVKEAEYWRAALRSKLGPGRHEILELGVGGGNNLSHLTRDFEATAVDLSEAMLEHSRRLNPGVEHHVGDMRSIRLHRKFDAVIIHDAISYMQTEDDLKAAFATAAAHLDPGGLFITAPDWFSETFSGPLVNHSVRSDGERELTYIEYDYDPDPSDTTMESIMFYLIRENGELRIEQDRHVFGLFPRETWRRLIDQAGLEVEILPVDLTDDPRQNEMLVGTLR